MPRPSQLHVEGLLWISDFPAEPAAIGVSSAMTPNLLPQLASVALPAGYAVSLNIRCMGADVRAGLLQRVGECLRWNRVSFTSLSTFLPPRAPDLHLACGAGRISRDRFRNGQCVSRSPIETPRNFFCQSVHDHVFDIFSRRRMCRGREVVTTARQCRHTTKRAMEDMEVCRQLCTSVLEACLRLGSSRKLSEHHPHLTEH